MTQTSKKDYKAPDTIREINVIDIKDLEKEASEIIPKGGFGLSTSISFKQGLKRIVL